MGLDITAYRRLEDPEPCGVDDEGGEKQVRFRINDAFAGRAGDVDEQTLYSFREAFAFRAGSYSGYSAWRAELAAMVGTTPQACWDGLYRGPFAELINFSDCEGTIAGVDADKLYRDFCDNLPRAEAWIEDESRPKADGEWFARYRDWMKAFELAADDGAVSFH